MKHLLVTGVLGVFLVVAGAQNALETLQRREDFSKFYELVAKDPTAEAVLKFKTVTVFVPVNRAVTDAEARNQDTGNNFASYHILMQLAEKNIFPSNVGTFLSASAPLFLSKHEVEETGNTEYYANNARIIDTLELRAAGNMRQLIYIIDEVLEPFVSSTGYQVDAANFLSNPSLYSVSTDVSAFAKRVRDEKQEGVFQMSGNHTFFIPMGLSDSDNRLKQIDSMVIQGHMIPNQVLFTRVMGTGPYKSKAYKEDIKVEISLINSSNPNEGTSVLKVQSNTLQSGSSHGKGVVLSQIVRANIPVKNGVVHLISSPLMIIDISVWQFIQSEHNGRLSKLNDLIAIANDFRFDILGQSQKTFFAPNNDAIERFGIEKLKNLKANISAVTTLLNMHVVRSSVSTDDVKSRRITELPSGDSRKKLYFSIVGDERNRTLSVQGGGVNALAVQADVGATDGIVHIIDRVLGMPYLSVYETLKETESELNETYELSAQDNWNAKLKDQVKKFTFFTPSNDAWRAMKESNPTHYKQLHMGGSYSHYVKKILDRHLLVGRTLNLHDLQKESELQMTNAVLKIERVRERDSDELYVVWEGIRAKITRPDVQATNGIIHIIDNVMMKKRDMIKSEATFVSSSLLTLVLGFFLTAL